MPPQQHRNTIGQVKSQTEELPSKRPDLIAAVTEVDDIAIAAVGETVIGIEDRVR